MTELSIAANMPPPAVYVIDDGSINAMAVGTRPDNAAIAVTSGLLRRFDREQLQGVIAHELGHIRNLDTRYGVYVAILVGLVALVTDGFLRMVLRAWKEGVFFRGAAQRRRCQGRPRRAWPPASVFGLFLLARRDAAARLRAARRRCWSRPRSAGSASTSPTRRQSS